MFCAFYQSGINFVSFLNQVWIMLDEILLYYGFLYFFMGDAFHKKFAFISRERFY